MFVIRGRDFSEWEAFIFKASAKIANNAQLGHNEIQRQSKAMHQQSLLSSLAGKLAWQRLVQYKRMNLGKGRKRERERIKRKGAPLSSFPFTEPGQSLFLMLSTRSRAPSCSGPLRVSSNLLGTYYFEQPRKHCPKSRWATTPIWEAL